MNGLGVLYSDMATQEAEWADIPDRVKTKRLREVYWAHRAVKIYSSSNGSIGLRYIRRTKRDDIGRKPNDPGDWFVCLVNITPRPREIFEWLEVTEVFSTVPAKRVEEAMRARHGISGGPTVDFGDFEKSLNPECPAGEDQRKAADQVIGQVKRKLIKPSYNDLRERYGYGTLVVGLPLWFALPPAVPFNAENAPDDFVSRVGLGLMDVRRKILENENCPFKRVIVLWETTSRAMSDAGFSDMGASALILHIEAKAPRKISEP